MIPSESSLYLAFAMIGGLAFSFLAFVFFGPLFFRKRIGRKYSYFSDFPFELFDGAESNGKLLTRIFGGAFLLFDLVAAMFLVDAFVFYPHGVFFLALLAAFFHLARVILLFFLMILPARYNKPHILVVALYFVSAALSYILEGIFLIRYSNGDGGPMAMALLLIAFGAIDLFLMANPRFGEWAKMASEQMADGEVVVKRPKYFLLAYSEWLGILLDALASLSLLFAFLLLFLR